jgi:hypothetical protein
MPLKEHRDFHVVDFFFVDFRDGMMDCDDWFFGGKQDCDGRV